MMITGWTKSAKTVTPSWLLRKTRGRRVKTDRCRRWASFVRKTSNMSLHEKCQERKTQQILMFDVVFNWIMFSMFFLHVSPPQSSDSLMSSFLLYSDDSENWQQVWCVLTMTESVTLCLYTSPQVGPFQCNRTVACFLWILIQWSVTQICFPKLLHKLLDPTAFTYLPSTLFQDVKPLSCIPLLGYNVEDSPQLNGQPCFCLSQSKAIHTFSCDDLNLKETWLGVLRDSVDFLPEGILDEWHLHRWHRLLN